MNQSQRGRWLQRPRILLTAIGLLLAVGACAFGVTALRGNAAPGRPFSLIYPRYDTLIATVNATGQMEPAQIVNLSFSGAGRVSEVLVKVGDQVAKDAPLARLDARDLRIRVAQAAAGLAQAQASYEKLRAGATPEEIAAAEAQAAQAAGQLRQTQGGVTAADLRAAEAQLAQAQAQLESQRDQLSAAKTRAELQMQQAVDALTQAQSRYSTAKQNWQYVQDTGRDPVVSIDTRTGARVHAKLSDTQRQQYYDAFVQAEAAMHSAE